MKSPALDHDIDIGLWFLMSENTWDDHYGSPAADLVLISKDKVGFKVDALAHEQEMVSFFHAPSQTRSDWSHHGSHFVKDIIGNPPVKPAESGPMNLGYASPTVRLFIDLAYS